MLLAGLTGGIGAGKSAVSALFEDRGAKIVDADTVARDVVGPGTVGFDLVVSAFGKRFVLPDGQLDRRGLGHLVFNDSKSLAVLNSIVHPLVRADVQARVDEFEATEETVIQVVPLLIESGQYRSDVVIVVDCDTKIAIERLIRTRGWTEEESKARVAAQIDREARLSKADLVIDNSSTKSHLVQEVDRCWLALEALKTQP